MFIALILGIMIACAYPMFARVFGVMLGLLVCIGAAFFVLAFITSEDEED